MSKVSASTRTTRRRAPSGASACPQVNFAFESCLDLLAEEVGISAWEIRMRNAIRPGGCLPNGQIAGPDTALVECLLAVKDEYEAAPGRAGPRLRLQEHGHRGGEPRRGTLLRLRATGWDRAALGGGLHRAGPGDRTCTGGLRHAGAAGIDGFLHEARQRAHARFGHHDRLAPDPAGGRGLPAAPAWTCLEAAGGGGGALGRPCRRRRGNRRHLRRRPTPRRETATDASRRAEPPAFPYAALAGRLFSRRILSRDRPL